MASNFTLNLRLSVMNLTPCFFRRWKVSSWDDFNTGPAEAVRKISIGFKTYWVTATTAQEDGFANFVAYGLLARTPKKYVYFNLHATDPRSGRSKSVGVGDTWPGKLRSAAAQLRAL